MNAFQWLLAKKSFPECQRKYEDGRCTLTYGQRECTMLYRTLGFQSEIGVKIRGLQLNSWSQKMKFF